MRLIDADDLLKTIRMEKKAIGDILDVDTVESWIEINAERAEKLESDKVIKGLECCTTDGECEELNCPWIEYSSQRDCVFKIMYGALNLIREQQYQLDEWKKYAPFLAMHGMLKKEGA